MGSDAGDQFIYPDELHFILADQAGGFQIIRIANLSGNVIRFVTAVGIISDGQDGLDGMRIGFIILGSEYNNSFGSMGIDNLQISQVNGAACAADQAGGFQVGHPGFDLVFHLDLVFISQNGNASTLLVTVGNNQF